MARKKKEMKQDLMQDEGQEPVILKEIDEVKVVKKKHNEGKIFEQSFADSWKDEYFIYRLRDSASSFGKKAEGVRFTTSNIADFFAFANGNIYILELKSTQSKSLSFSNIRPFQLKGMHESGKKEGVNSFFVINFRCTNETFAVRADKLYDEVIADVKKSVNIQWCRDNGVLINQKLKKVKYTYNIEDLLNIA